MEFTHIPVLLNETIESLNINPNGIYVDGTAGGAGHSTEIAKKLKNGRLISIDRDPDAILVATERLKDYNATVVQGNFCDIKEILEQLKIDSIDGMMMDLGVSSHQLDEGDRGFSYHKDAPLDMRMSQSGTTAADLVNELSVKELCNIFDKFGEEKFAYKIALGIDRARKEKRIETTLELADIIRDSVPAAARRDGHPARKCFQALRIAVNGELDYLESSIRDAFSVLKVGGILSIITFHSLEDRIVKKTFAELCKGCECPPDIPICVCGKTPDGELVTRKPVAPSEQELELNPRSRSAKLRSIRKIK
jgi:16S rRNA (cytosine1402-N4)-methyltransferase